MTVCLSERHHSLTVYGSIRTLFSCMLNVYEEKIRMSIEAFTMNRNYVNCSSEGILQPCGSGTFELS